MARNQNVKKVFDNEEDYKDALQTVNIAGGGLLVPVSMQTDGLELAVVATGVQELRPTKKSTDENPIHYGATEVETEDGLRFFVLNTTYYPKGSKMTIKVQKSVNADTKQDQYGFNLVGTSISKGATATA